MRTKFKDIADSVTDEDFKAFMGDNVEKFTPTRQRLLDGKKTSWDWLVFFFAVPWAIHYRYHPVLNGYIVLISAAIVWAAWDAGPITGLFGFSLIASLFALRFKLGYVKSAHKKIYKIKKKYVERDEQLDEIANAGKTFKILTWYNLLLLGLFIAYSLYQVSIDIELQQSISNFLAGKKDYES
jgi:hypothetical protein